MSASPKDARTFKVGDHGDLLVPREFVDAAGLGPRSLVRIRVDGTSIVIEKAAPTANPLDGPLGKKADKDLFAKIKGEQQAERERLREKFEKGLAETPKDPDEPPDHPFRWD